MHPEGRFSTRLLSRTSRRARLAQSGELYFQQGRLMPDTLDEVEAALSNVTVIPHEKVRFSAPVWFANGDLAALEDMGMTLLSQ